MTNAHPDAAPALKKNHSLLLFWVAFLSIALLLATLWHFIPPKIRVTNVNVEFNPGRATAGAQVVNNTDHSVKVTLRFTIGYQVVEAKGSTRFLPLGEHTASYVLDPHAMVHVSSDFTLPQGKVPTMADVQIINCE